MTMTFETAKLRDACNADQDILNKLTIIRSDAPTYGDPGPENLGDHTRHAHITNTLGVAWRYQGTPLGSDQHILALGKKNNKAKSGNSQYDWDENGKV